MDFHHQEVLYVSFIKRQASASKDQKLSMATFPNVVRLCDVALLLSTKKFVEETTSLDQTYNLEDFDTTKRCISDFSNYVEENERRFCQLRKSDGALAGCLLINEKGGGEPRWFCVKPSSLICKNVEWHIHFLVVSSSGIRHCILALKDICSFTTFLLFYHAV